MPASARAKRTPTSPSKQRSTATVNLRVPQETRELIDNAAAALGKSRTEFMLDSARREAIDVLLDSNRRDRAKTSWTVGELAAKLGMGNDTLSKWTKRAGVPGAEVGQRSKVFIADERRKILTKIAQESFTDRHKRAAQAMLKSE